MRTIAHARIASLFAGTQVCGLVFFGFEYFWYERRAFVRTIA